MFDRRSTLSHAGRWVGILAFPWAIGSSSSRTLSCHPWGRRVRSARSRCGSRSWRSRVARSSRGGPRPADGWDGCPGSTGSWPGLSLWARLSPRAIELTLPDEGTRRFAWDDVAALVPNHRWRDMGSAELRAPDGSLLALIPARSRVPEGGLAKRRDPGGSGRRDETRSLCDHRRRRVGSVAKAGARALSPPSASAAAPESVGALARLARIEPRIGLARLLLVLQLLGAEIPVVDLLGQPVLHRRFGLVEQRQLARPDLRKMLRHDMGDGVPCAFSSSSRPIQPHSGRARSSATPGSPSFSGR